MYFERDESGNFIVDGIIIPKQIFLEMEPNYSEPEGTIFLYYESGVGRRIRTNAKEYKIPGNWADGERYISRLNQFNSASASISLEQQQQDKEVQTAVYDSLPNRDKRRLEYPPLEDLVVAMWENLIEKKTKKISGVEAIQKLRKIIKAKYPTENTDAISTDETEVS